ncbi:MAG TPA: ZIP family metal transporter [Candidatus Dormibacteraeota bacterium]|nr:ZIP family metal transporter [Candidatus Dormibacteraeota bacterium]
MSHLAAAGLGAIAGATIFIGLPIGRIRGVSKGVQGILNAVATGVLIFLLWDILSHASAPVETALAAMHRGDRSFLALAAIFAAGLAAGLLALIYVNGRLFGRTKHAPPAPPRTLAMMIATGLGLHNLSEGLAIGQSAATGAVAFAVVLVIGFALHNITEGFGIAAPLAMDTPMPSWSFLALAGLVGGGPTFLGTVVGYVFTSTYIYVLFLALAAGALLYVINEMFHLGRRLNSPAAMGWGLLLGFLLAYATDLFLTYNAV